MARTIEYWYNYLIEQKQSFALLNDLMPVYDLQQPSVDNPFRLLMDEINTPSKVGVWRLSMLLVAYALHNFEKFLDVFKAEVDTLAEESIAGNMAWYAAQVRKFQYGFALVWNSNTYRYYYTDTTSAAAVSARIVKKVSITEVTGTYGTAVVIKVAKEVGGNLTRLDNSPGTELDALETYINRVKFAGVKTTVVSLNPDKVKLYIKRYYNGTLNIADVKASDETALKTFLKQIDFDGVLHINDIVDCFQNLSSSIEPSATVITCGCKADSDIAYTTITESYSPASGWFELVPIGNTIGVDTVIEYVAL